jgi:hypothetical protein
VDVTDGERIRAWAYANMDAIEAARAAYAPGTGAPPTPIATPAHTAHAAEPQVTNW